MKCPHCSHVEDHVIDSRPIETANVIRRRRECLGCAKRFTTYERFEAMPLIVLKSDNRRELFDRNKLREGIVRACKKRNITSDQIEQLVADVETELQEDYVLEAPSRVVGDLVLEKLRKLDPVAYVRFASVYKQFSDIDTFLRELQTLKQEQLKEKKELTKELVTAHTNAIDNTH
ncbi:MAG: transcriptional regulator NrdR [Elusimicrobia bacterium]|nr:transcriptional regulator NrdR [Candidatus Obscuribacterium magneticum]